MTPGHARLLFNVTMTNYHDHQLIDISCLF